jgi:uncharacterized membrane protein YccF (DUF307 family)
MNLLLNILWAFLGGGIILFFQYIISGLLLCITIVGIPFGLQCFKLAVFALAPFGSQTVEVTDSGGCLLVVFNVLWLLLGGLSIVIMHLVLALLFTLTIIGIPFAIQHVKMAGFAITPFGKRVT